MNAFGLRLDWRVMIVVVGVVATISALSFTVFGSNASPADERPAGVTTGISPANTVYPPRQR